MAIGDDALAAGIPLVNGATDLVRDGADHHNETRDYLAQRTNAIQPVAQGGTGADNAAAARTNLGITPANIGAQAALGFTPARREPGSAHSVGFYTVSNSDLYFRPEPSTGDFDYRLARASEIPSTAGFVTAGSDVSFGNIYSPAGRANPVVNNYVVAYLNADGRLGATPSSLRFKTVIGDYEGSILDLRPIIYTIDADETDTPRIGLVAEEVAAIDPRLVAYDDEGPFTVHYSDQLVVALLAEVQRLAARLDALEGER